MESAEESNAGGRVTRSLRKRLVSVDSEASCSRPGSPMVSKMNVITEASDDVPQKPVRLTRRNSITSAISTPNKATRSAALRAETPDLIGSPARKSTRKRSVSITEEEFSHAATAATKSAVVKSKQQQFDVLLEEATESNENSKSEKSSNRLSNKQRKPGPKSRSKKFEGSDQVEVVNLDYVDSSNKQSGIIDLVDDSIVENNEKEDNIVEPEHIKDTEDQNGATIKVETVHTNIESTPDHFKVLTNDTENANTSSKNISVKQDLKKKSTQSIFESSDSSGDASETQTPPLEKSKKSVVVVTSIEKLDNLTPQTMVKLNITPQNSPVKNKNGSSITKSVAFNNSDSENVVKSTFPKTPGLTKSKSYIDMDSSKETPADHSYQSEKDSVASFKDAEANADVSFIPETQEVKEEQQSQSSKGSGADFLDATNADDVYDINPLIQRLAADDAYDSNPLSENTPHKAPKLLKNVQSSTPLLDAATKHLKKTTEEETAAVETQEKLQVSLDSPEKSLSMSKRSGETPNSSLKLLGKSAIKVSKSPLNSIENLKSVENNELIEEAAEADSNEADEIETTRSNDVSSLTAAEKSLISEVAQKTQESSATSPFARSWTQSISGKADKNTSQKIDAIVPDDSFNAKTTENINEKAESDDEQPAKVVSKRNSRYASEDDEEGDGTLPADNADNDDDEEEEYLSEQDGEFEGFIVDDNDYLRKKKSSKKSAFLDDEAMEIDDYVSGDSMDEEERCEIEDNEISEEGLSLGSEDSEEEDNEEPEADSFIVSDTEEPITLEYSDDDEHLESDHAKEENADDQKKEKKAYKRIQTISSDSESDAELVEVNKSKENYSNKEEGLHNKDDASQDELTDVNESVVEAENSKELNSAKESEKKKKNKSSLLSVETIGKLNSSSSRRKSLNKSSTVVSTDEVGNVSTQDHTRPSTTSAFRRPSLRRSDAAVVESKDSDDMQNKSFKSIRQHSKIGEEAVVQTAEEENDNVKRELKKRVSLNQSRSEKKLKSAQNESKLKETSDEEQSINDVAEERKNVAQSVSQINESKRESLSQSLSKERRKSMPNDSPLSGKDKHGNSKKDKVVDEKNDSEIRKPKRTSLDQSRVRDSRKSLPSGNKLNSSKADHGNRDPRKSLPSGSKLNSSKAEHANKEKGHDGDDEMEEASEFEDIHTLSKSLNVSYKTKTTDSKVKEKRDKSHRASLQRSVAVHKERSLSSSAARDDDSNAKCSSKKIVNDATNKENAKNLNSSLTIGKITMETKLADQDTTPSSSEPEQENEHKESEDDNDQRAKFSSEDEKQLEKLTKMDKLDASLCSKKSRRQSLAIPVASHPAIASSSTKPKRHSMISPSILVKNEKGESYVVTIDGRTREVQTEKLKRKRFSNTLDNTLPDDVRHLHKKSKFVKDTNDVVKLNLKDVSASVVNHCDEVLKAVNNNLVIDYDDDGNDSDNDSDMNSEIIKDTKDAAKSKFKDVSANEVSRCDEILESVNNNANADDDYCDSDLNTKIVTDLTKEAKSVVKDLMEKQRDAPASESPVPLDTTNIERVAKNRRSEDIQHLHKKSKIAKDTTDEAKSVVADRKKMQSAGKSQSSSKGRDVVRIMSRCDEILAAANQAKLEAKLNYKKSLVRLPKKSRKRSHPMNNDDQKEEEEIDVDMEKEIDEEEIFVPLVSQKHSEQHKEKTKLAVTKALQASVAILTAPPLGMKRKNNKALLNKIDEDKRPEKGHSQQMREVSFYTDEKVLTKKKNRSMQKKSNEDKRADHSQQCWELSSDADEKTQKKRKNKDLLKKTDDDNRVKKSHSKHKREVSFDTDEKDRKGKRKLESRNRDKNGKENLTHGSHHHHHHHHKHQQKSHSGNIINAEKNNTKKKTLMLVTGEVLVEPATPRKITTSSVSGGFRESPLPPRIVKPFKTHHGAHSQDAPLSSSSSSMQRKRPIDEPVLSPLPESQWTQSGPFVEEKLSAAARKTKKVGATVEAINARALNFKQGQMFRSDIPRESARAVQQRKQRANWYN